jgi:hypothetical protein
MAVIMDLCDILIPVIQSKINHTRILIIAQLDDKVLLYLLGCTQTVPLGRASVSSLKLATISNTASRVWVCVQASNCSSLILKSGVVRVIRFAVRVRLTVTLVSGSCYAVPLVLIQRATQIPLSICAGYTQYPCGKCISYHQKLTQPVTEMCTRNLSWG